MGESTCLMHSFSLGLDSGTASATPTQLRDPLGESISFGRFMSDSLAWDKWSNFSHKRYVEEAARYSRPGSVAQKKAFFEAYYKRKALLAQENANAPDQQSDNHASVTEMQSHGTSLDVTPTHPVEQPVPPQDGFDVQNVNVATEKSVAFISISESQDDKEKLASMDNACKSKGMPAEPELSAATTEVSEDSEMDKPLLKDRNANQEVCSNMRKPKPPPVLSLKPAASLWPSAKVSSCPPPKPVDHSKKENVLPMNTSSALESLERIKMSPKPLIARTPVSRGAVNSSKGGKDSITPLRTPTMAKKATVTPKSESRRNMTPLESATPGNKTTGAKWRFLSGLDFSTCLSATCRNKARPSSPFNFRTEERAAKRKEKLELKFNAKVLQKVQLQTKLKDKAESELKKLRQTLCFRARPLPSFYKARKDNLISTNPPVAPKSPNPQQAGRIAKEDPAHRPYSSQKNKVSASATKKSRTRPRSLDAMISSKNNSPNITKMKAEEI